MNGSVRALIVPRPTSARRPTGSVAKVPWALAEGVRSLTAEPRIPDLFSEQVVRRIANVGERVDKDGLLGVDLIAVLHGQPSASATVEKITTRNAQQAVLPASSARSSVVGVLNLLSQKRDKVRGLDKVRGVIEDRQTHRGVICNLDGIPRQTIKDLWGETVVAWGTLTRNSSGQAVRLVVEDLAPVEASAVMDATLTARDLLGSDPEYTGKLTTQEHMDLVRRRG